MRDRQTYLRRTVRKGDFLHSGQRMSASSQVLDPVCGMLIDPATAAGTRTRRGITSYLCSAGCIAKFDADADAYIAATRVDDYHTWRAATDPNLPS